MSDKEKTTMNMDPFATEMLENLEQFPYFMTNNVFGRDKVVSLMLDHLSNKDKSKILLIGDYGSGVKTTLRKLSAHIYAESCKMLVGVNIDKLLAMPGNTGQILNAFTELMEDLAYSDRYVPVVYNVGKYLNANLYSVFGYNIVNKLMGMDIPVIMTCTSKDIDTVEKNHTWLFQQGVIKIQNKELDITTTEEVFDYYQPLFENEWNVVQMDPSFKQQIISAADKYVKNDQFPGKALRLANLVLSNIARTSLDHSESEEVYRTLAETYVKMAQSKNGKYVDECSRLDTKLWLLKQRMKNVRLKVSKQDIVNALSELLNIPNYSLDGASLDSLKQIEPKILEKIKGQDETIKSVVSAIKRSRFGLKKTGHTIGNFFFIGPTGVGKTATAKQVAKVLYGSEDKLLRFDMSEYQADIDVSKLIGSPPGYVGFKETGVLTQGLQKHPDSIVLFDEIEKASPKIYNVLLQLLDEGFITSGDGKKVDARQCLIIFTSNVGVKAAKEKRNPVGYSNQTQDEQREVLERDTIEKSLKDRFAPEFLNRIDAICYFKDLDKETLGEILETELHDTSELIRNVLPNKELVLTKQAKEYIINKTYDEKNGARPITRIVEQEIESQISDMIIDGAFLKSRSKKIKITYDEENKKLQIS